MSVQLNFCIECKDSDGVWHLVKWVSNKKYNNYEGLYETKIGDEEVVVNNEYYPGLAWRDELSWGARDIFIDGLPSDISEEVKNWRDKDIQKSREWAMKVLGKESDNYCRKFHYSLLSEMYGYANKKLEEWKKELLKKIENERMTEVSEKLDRIEAIVSGKEPKKKKKKKDDDSVYYEDTIDYTLEESLNEVLYLLNETNSIYNIVKLYTDDTWFNENDVRVIYWLD